MRAVIQRVSSARVEVASEVVGQIEAGLLVYLSVGDGDAERDAEFMGGKDSESADIRRQRGEDESQRAGRGGTDSVSE